jgi:DNA-binding CsgD family transcriptional regulator
MTHDQKRSTFAGFATAHPAEGEPVRPAALAIPSAILASTALLVGLDVASDARAGSSAGHIALELGIVAVALAGAIALWAQLLLARRRARALEGDLVRAEADFARFREESAEHLRGLSAAIDRQFDRWALSAAEREVALLLLKGLALKEIAAARETSERTVRQQALAVYRKAGLAGRAELSAFFLEDLLAPAQRGTEELARGGGEGR